MNSRVALWRTTLPLGRRKDVTVPGLPSNCAQKAAARRTQTEEGASACFGLLCTSFNLLLAISISSGSLCMMDPEPCCSVHLLLPHAGTKHLAAQVCRHGEPSTGSFDD